MTTKKKTTAKAPSSKKSSAKPKMQKKFDLVPTGSAGYYMLDPVPEGFEKATSHVFVSRDAWDRVFNKQWSTAVRDRLPKVPAGNKQKESWDLTIPGSRVSCGSGRKPTTITFTEAMAVGKPLPSRVADNAANRKKNEAHAAAIWKVLDACLSFGSLPRLIDGIKALTAEENITITATMSDKDIEKKVKEAKDKMAGSKAIQKALAGLDENESKAVLRHAAHVFNIPKGATNLR